MAVEEVDEVGKTISKGCEVELGRMGSLWSSSYFEWFKMKTKAAVLLILKYF
jgi:hypothetical protein